MTKLLIIYGSEASGKLTIARELTALTNFKLFHNHISIEVGRVLFEYGDKAYNELVWKVRLAVFEAAAKNSVPGLIFTWAYSHPDFQPELDSILDTVTPFGVEVLFVHVTCSQKTLETRVVRDDRRKAGKAHTIEALHRQQAAKNHVVIPDSNSLVVDNTNLAPEDAARLIINEFDLV